MEKMSDFFKHFTERFKNPLIISFFISWSLFNWRALIAVVLYTRQDLEAEKVETINQYISKVVNNWNGIVYPFLSACAFTVIYPFLTALVYVLYGKIKSVGRDYYLKWTKSSTIPTVQFIELQEEVEKLIGDIQKVYKEKSEFQVEKAKNLIQIQENEKRIHQLESDIEMHSVKMIEGPWYVKTLKSLDEESEVWNFEGLGVRRENKAEKEIEFQANRQLTISNFMSDGKMVVIFFKVLGIPYDYHVLEIDRNSIDMTGHDKAGQPIRYRKFEVRKTISESEYTGPSFFQ